MGSSYRLSIVSLMLACTWMSLAVSEGLAQGTLEDYQRAQRFLPGNLRDVAFISDMTPNWIGKTNRFWYRKAQAKQSEFILVDAEQNATGPAFDHARLAQALSQAAGHEYRATELPFMFFDFVQDGKAIRFQVQSATWTCELSDYRCQEDLTARERTNEAVSPDKRWAAYVKEHNLYLRNVSTGEVVQLTNDGASEWDYATPLPSLRVMVTQGKEDVAQPPAVFWAPDSSRLVTYRLDSRNAGRFTSLQYVPSDQLRPKAFTYAYPLPGEVLAKAAPLIFETPSGKRIEVKTPPIDIHFQGGPGFLWFPDSEHFRYNEVERGHKAIELRVVDAKTGEQKKVIREDSAAYVDPGQTFFRFIGASTPSRENPPRTATPPRATAARVGDPGAGDPGAVDVVYSSERDGWNHLYLHSPAMAKDIQITSGPWAVRRIEHIDEKNRRVYFIAGGREKDEDPYATHLYSIGLDGKGLMALSPEKANHLVSFSSDGTFFVDAYSRPDLPGAIVLRRSNDGSEIRTLEKLEAAEPFRSSMFPEPFHGKAADGATDLFGLIWRPSNFDPSKKYPVLEQVYTGPHGFFVPKTFPAALRGSEQPMAELGFIVVMVDGRGTAGRSRAFREFSYRNLGGAFADHVAMIQQMAARYPYMDLSRVGIYGTSAGGYGAAHAMLAFPDFYKVGVSISGDHDARLDKAWWNELYQGYPVQEDYVTQSNVTMAGRLQGHLLLEHGDVDDNVHPVETMRFVDALIRANKNFDMLFVPNMFHGEGGNSYLVRRRWDYFVQHLLGVAPPIGFEIKEERGATARQQGTLP